MPYFNPNIFLMSQQASPLAIPEGFTPEMTVVGQTPDTVEAPQEPDLYKDFSLNNTDAVREQNNALQQAGEASDRRGMFGTRGTLRDILGVLGDAFLVQSGNKSVYAPTRQQERISDAMAGFTVDPLSAMERVGGYDPEAAQKMYDDYLTQDYRQGQLASIEGSRQDQAQNRLNDNITVSRNRIANMMQVAGNNPARRAFVYQEALREADRLGVGIEALGFPPEVGGMLTDDQAAVIAGSAINPYQQQQLPIAQKRADTSQQQADTAARRADIAESREPRPRSEYEIAKEIANNPDATPFEKQWLEGYMSRNSGNRRGSRARPPGGPTQPNRTSPRFR